VGNELCGLVLGPIRLEKEKGKKNMTPTRKEKERKE
jgi:hypothetical protein